MQAGTVSRLRFCGRSGRFKIYFWRNIVRFRKVIRLFQWVGCARNKLLFLTVQPNLKLSHWTLDWDWMGLPALELWDLIVSVLGNTTQNHDRTEKPVVCRDKNHVRQQSQRVINVLDNFDLVPSNVRFSHQEALLYVFWRQRGSDQDDYWGEESPTMRHVPETTELLLIGCSIESIWTPKSMKLGLLKSGKSDELMDDRTERPVVCPQRGAQQFVIGDDEAESDLSLGSRSFLHRVNDQVRKRQKQSSMDATEDSEEHSVIWGIFMSSTLQSSIFMVKNYSDSWHSIKKTKDLTMTQMFDIPAKLVSEQDEIYGVKTINWESSSWKCLSVIGDEQVISLQRTRVYVFQILYCVLERWTGTLDQTQHGNKAWSGSKVHRNAEPWTELVVSHWNSSAISSQDSIRCSFVRKFKSYCWD